MLWQPFLSKIDAWARESFGGVIEATCRRTLTFLCVTAAVVRPMILAVVLVAMDMRADLSDLKPASEVDDRGAAPVRWQDLSERDEVFVSVQMIGYKMDETPSARDRTSVNKLHFVT